mgnify:CR=1 FL=1
MKRLVLKFGGTSLGTIEKIKKVAGIIKKKFSEGNEIIVVVSAMAGVTDELKAKSDLISKNFDDGELDVLLSSGEQASCSLLSGALINLDVKARSWLGWQIPILTDKNHTSSQMAPEPLESPHRDNVRKDRSHESQVQDILAPQREKLLPL